MTENRVPESFAGKQLISICFIEKNKVGKRLSYGTFRVKEKTSPRENTNDNVVELVEMKESKTCCECRNLTDESTVKSQVSLKLSVGTFECCNCDGKCTFGCNIL